MDHHAPVVAVPGLGLGPESWRPALDAMGAHDATVLLLPGYGVPVDPPAVATPAELAGDVCRRLNGPTTLCGHSSSCQVVAHAARIRPDLVSRLVLVGPTTDPRATTWPRLAGLWLRNLGHEDPRQAPRVVRQWRRTSLRSMLATMDAARHDAILETMRQVACPVILVRGTGDRICRADWLTTLADTGGEAGAPRTTVEIPAGAHMVASTHPGPFAAQVGALVR